MAILHPTMEDCPNSALAPSTEIFTHHLLRGAAEAANVFTRNATAYGTRVHVNHHTGWEPTIVGTTASFAGSGWCLEMNNQLTDATFDRFHFRYRQSPVYDFYYGDVTLGAGHHEDYIDPYEASFKGWDCSWHGNHAVDENGTYGSGFDQGRAKIYNSFVGTHHVYGGLGDWGNTHMFQQCDEGWAQSNGGVGWWQVL